MARISTHVLDTARGKPAQGVAIDLHFIDLHFGGKFVKSAVTNVDGRTDEPLVAADRLETGIYELTFHAGDYFRATGVELADPPFLDVVVVRFGVADANGTYHVPLLLSPYGYSTYRGS
jgi:5-hydroxyisourate hydrolase